MKEIIDSMHEQYHVLGSVGTYVQSARPIDQADDDSLCFCKKTGEQALEMIRNSRAKVIVCSDSLDLSEADYQDKTLIQVSNPRLTFGRLLARYFVRGPEPSVHPTAVISEKAKIGRKVNIGPHSYIADCEIGDGTIIDGHVYIHDGTRIGKGVIIHAGVVIGAEAVAFERNEIGEWEKFPQIAGVIIEDDAEIGANSVICRGSLADTFIDKGTKIDTLVRVGHGVRIGKHCLIVAGTVINGSARIGDQTWIAPLVCIRESVTVGNRVLVGAGSVVHRNIADDLVVLGDPARPISKNTT